MHREHPYCSSLLTSVPFYIDLFFRYCLFCFWKMARYLEMHWKCPVVWEKRHIIVIFKWRSDSFRHLKMRTYHITSLTTVLWPITFELRPYWQYRLSSLQDSLVKILRFHLSYKKILSVEPPSPHYTLAETGFQPGSAWTQNIKWALKHLSYADFHMLNWYFSHHKLFVWNRWEKCNKSV